MENKIAGISVYLFEWGGSKSLPAYQINDAGRAKLKRLRTLSENERLRQQFCWIAPTTGMNLSIAIRVERTSWRAEDDIMEVQLSADRKESWCFASSFDASSAFENDFSDFITFQVNVLPFEGQESARNHGSALQFAKIKIDKNGTETGNVGKLSIRIIYGQSCGRLVKQGTLGQFHCPTAITEAANQRVKATHCMILQPVRKLNDCPRENHPWASNFRYGISSPSDCTFTFIYKDLSFENEVSKAQGFEPLPGLELTENLPTPLLVNAPSVESASPMSAEEFSQLERGAHVVSTVSDPEQTQTNADVSNITTTREVRFRGVSFRINVQAKPGMRKEELREFWSHWDREVSDEISENLLGACDDVFEQMFPRGA